MIESVIPKIKHRRYRNMRKKGSLRGLSRLIGLLLAICLLSGLCVQAAAEGTEAADKNILAYALMPER